MKKSDKRKQTKILKQKIEKASKIRKYQSSIRNFNIVAVFITKNEEENLPRLFKSLEGFADRTVIVDTGSTDNTVELAKTLGADVHQISWPDSFSDARNRAVELANTGKANWIAMFDADEILEDPVGLRKKLREVEDDIGVIGIYHRTRFGHRFPRNCIWRPGKAKWMYRFHEHLLPFEKNTQKVIVHYVDHPDDVGKNHTSSKILEMMRMDTVEYTDSATRKYYYGRQLFYNYDEACLEVLKEVYDVSKWQAEAAQAAVFAGNFFEKKRNELLASEEENKETLAEEANNIAANFYRMSIAKYPRLRGSYIGIIKTTNNNYERFIAAVTALKIKESTFFDDPPKFYDRESNQKLIEVVNHMQEELQKAEEAAKVENKETENVSNAEAVS